MASSSSYRQLQNEVTALKSQLDEQNKKFEAMFNFFAQNYQGQMSPNLAMFHPSPVSDQGSVPTNETNSQHGDDHI